MTTNDKSAPAGPTLRDWVESLVDEWQALIADTDGPKGGMRVPLHSLWGSAPQMPSVMSAIRRWTRDLAAALAAPPAQPVDKKLPKRNWQDGLTMEEADQEIAETFGQPAQPVTEPPTGFVPCPMGCGERWTQEFSGGCWPCLDAEAELFVRSTAAERAANPDWTPPAQPVREQGEATEPMCLSGCQYVMGNSDRVVFLHANGCPRDVQQSSPTAGPGPRDWVRCKAPGMGPCCHDYQLGRPGCGAYGPCKYVGSAAPPPSTGEPAGCSYPCDVCAAVCAQAVEAEKHPGGAPHLCRGHHATWNATVAAPPRKTPGELAQEWRQELQRVVDANAASSNEEFDAAITLKLRELITADRGGR